MPCEGTESTGFWWELRARHRCPRHLGRGPSLQLSRAQAQRQIPLLGELILHLVFLSVLLGNLTQYRTWLLQDHIWYPS